MRILFAITLALMFVSCSPFRSPSEPVHFVLPDGYRGGFQLILDPTNGVTFSKTNARYTIVIPANGQLRVHDFDILQRPHEEFAAYANGQSIPSDSLIKAANGMPTNMVGLRSQGTLVLDDGPKIVVFIVGTEQDRDEWFKNMRNVSK